MRLNGAKVGDHELDPAFTRYDRRVLYTTYDVTDQIKEGPNVLGVMLGHGWYDMHTRATWDFDRAPWRAEPALLCQLNIQYADGSTETVATDASWQASPGPIYFDSIRNGERYDARLEKPGWDTAGYNENWPAAAVVEGPAGKLAAQMMPPARITKTIEPVSIDEVSPGIWRFDMGQNLSGKAELHVSGAAGTKITLKYRELLKDDGTLDHRNAVYVFSGDFQTDTYILKGEGTEVWSPRFVYHGYRYVQVEGLPNPPTEDTLRAQVVHTDFETAGEFECSNKLLNRIQQNARWSYVGNYMGYPTDCPHREKNGWSGDAHLAAEMGLMNFHTGAAYTKWLDDFADEQNEAGEYAAIIPTCGWGYGIGPSWDCAYVLIPWYVYQYRGDTRILETHYDNLKRYVELLSTKAGNYMVDYGLGDWCPPLGDSSSHKSPRILTSTAYYYKDTDLLARMANVLGKSEDAAKYSALADNIKQAFNERLYDAETGLYAGDTQTSQACALYQGLATDRDKVFGQLLTQIEAADGHLDCGILGTKYLMRVLSDFGHTDVAYGIATKTTFPSWGHWLEQGATTLWERWDGDGSQNHIMFGDVSAWFYAALAGIAPDAEAPGFKRIIMHPRPVPGLTWARAWHNSPYGRIASHWQWENGQYRHEIVVPVNASALVYVPDTGAVTEHRRPVAEAEGVDEQAGIEGYRVFEVTSGGYVFEVPLPSQSDLLRY